jgi:hypothetical protein
MPSEVTDTRVRRVSFVGRAATRSHLEPDLPQRVLLWKAEGIPDTERTDMTATATAPRTEAEIERLETEWTQLLNQMFDDLETMRSDPDTPQRAVQRHEKAYGDLHRAMIGLRNPEAASALDARDHARDENTTDGERLLFAKCEQLVKADPRLSAAEQVRQAMRDPETLAAYYRESGTRPPAPLTRRDGLVKSADGYAEHAGAVDEVASRLEKSEGLSPTKAYAKALAASGVYAAAA